jgi:hypothetical protein
MREGFFDEDDVRKTLKYLPEYLRDLCFCASLTQCEQTVLDEPLRDSGDPQPGNGRSVELKRTAASSRGPGKWNSPRQNAYFSEN